MDLHLKLYLTLFIMHIAALNIEIVATVFYLLELETNFRGF